ncbi:hypothetical protein E3N88_16435 [Mikania micrantha]|uniref:Uncharacterized protein n=1 Tax=Mikania micrantha TaxID=192012 RepID=A0A5N6P1H9_9ASTR|nr:hypothetical protein E3N88_16435 [Mikania micrantha]
MPPRRQPALLPLPPNDSAPRSLTPTPPDSPTQPPPPPPPPVYQLDPATIALATLLTSQLRDVIPKMMNMVNSNNSEISQLVTEKQGGLRAYAGGATAQGPIF